jgi:hypothetical protein
LIIIKSERMTKLLFLFGILTLVFGFELQAERSALSIDSINLSSVLVGETC